VQHKKTTWVDKTAPVLVLFYLSRLSFLYFSGTVLSIQAVIFMLHWYCFVYPGCLSMLHWYCFIYTGCLFYVALVLFFYIQAVCTSATQKGNLDRQNSTSAT
jgi:hypothetical protein